MFIKRIAKEDIYALDYVLIDGQYAYRYSPELETDQTIRAGAMCRFEPGDTVLFYPPKGIIMTEEYAAKTTPGA